MSDRLQPPPPPKGFTNPNNHLVDMSRTTDLANSLYDAYEQLERAELEGLAPSPPRLLGLTEAESIHTPMSRAPRNLRSRNLKASLLLDVVTSDGIARPWQHIVRDAFAVHEQLRLQLKLKDELPRHYLNNTALLWRPLTPRVLFNGTMDTALLQAMHVGYCAFTKRPLYEFTEPVITLENNNSGSTSLREYAYYFYTVDPPENTIPLISIGPV